MQPELNNDKEYSNMMLNLFKADFQSLNGIVHFLEMFFNARYISLNMASSLGKCPRLFSSEATLGTFVFGSPHAMDFLEARALLENDDGTVSLSAQQSKGNDPEQRLAKGTLQPAEAKTEVEAFSIDESWLDVPTRSPSLAVQSQ